jgi:hypothetical protein
MGMTKDDFAALFEKYGMDVAGDVFYIEEMATILCQNLRKGILINDLRYLEGLVADLATRLEAQHDFD